MTNAEMHRQDLLRIIADYPQEFTYAGTVYTGTYSGLTSNRPLGIGGFQQEPQLTLVVNVNNADGSAVFSALPSIGNKVTINDVSYRIDGTELDPTGEAWQMNLASEAL